MEIEKEKIEMVLIDCIKELQALSGEEDIEVSLLTRPYFDLPNYDSLRALETMCHLGVKLEIEVEIVAVFFNVDDDGLPPTVKKISQAIYDSLMVKGVAHE